MNEKMPRCPDEHREQIVQRVSTKSWEGCTLSRAVGICSHNYIRHELTDYEIWLKRHKLDRDEARMLVKADLDEIFNSWLKKKRRRRRKRKRADASP